MSASDYDRAFDNVAPVQATRLPVTPVHLLLVPSPRSSARQWLKPQRLVGGRIHPDIDLLLSSQHYRHGFALDWRHDIVRLGDEIFVLVFCGFVFFFFSFV